MSRPCSPFSPRTTSWPALIQKGLVFRALPYSAHDTSASQSPTPFLFCSSTHRFAYSFIILCYIPLLPSPHYIRQLMSLTFTSSGKTTLLPLFGRPLIVVRSSAPLPALLIRCLVTVFSLSHNPSPPDIPSTHDNVPTAHLRTLIGVVFLARRSEKRLLRALEGGSYRLRGAIGWAR